MGRTHGAGVTQPLRPPREHPRFDPDLVTRQITRGGLVLILLCILKINISLLQSVLGSV